MMILFNMHMYRQAQRRLVQYRRLRMMQIQTRKATHLLVGEWSPAVSKP